MNPNSPISKFQIFEYFETKSLLEVDANLEIEKNSNEPTVLIRLFKETLNAQNSLQLLDLHLKIYDKIVSLKENQLLDETCINLFKECLPRFKSLMQLKTYSIDLREENIFDYMLLAQQLNSIVDIQNAHKNIKKIFDIDLEIKWNNHLYEIIFIDSTRPEELYVKFISSFFKEASSEFRIIFKDLSKEVEKKTRVDIFQKFLGDEDHFTLEDCVSFIEIMGLGIENLERELMQSYFAYPQDLDDCLVVFEDLLYKEASITPLSETKTRFLKELGSKLKTILETEFLNPNEMDRLNLALKKYEYFLKDRPLYQQRLKNLILVGLRLDAQNVFSFLSEAITLGCRSEIDKGLDFLSEHLNFDCGFKEGVFYFKIESFKLFNSLNSFDLLIECIYQISQTVKVKLFLDLFVNDDHQENDHQVMTILQKFGSFVLEVNMESNLEIDLFDLIHEVNSYCKNLLKLTIQSPSLQSFPENLPSTLEVISFMMCHDLMNLPSSLPESLKFLTLEQCDSIKELQPTPKALNQLKLISCENLMSIPKLNASLEILYLSDCEKIDRLPDEIPMGLKEIVVESRNSIVNFKDFIKKAFLQNQNQAIRLSASLLKNKREWIESLKENAYQLNIENLDNMFSELNEDYFNSIFIHLLEKDFEKTIDRIKVTYLNKSLINLIKKHELFKEMQNYRYADQSSYQKEMNFEKLEDLLDIDFKVVFNLLDALNLFKADQPHYVDLKRFRGDGGEFVDLDHVKLGFNYMIDKAENHQRNESLDPDYYDKFTRLFKNFIKKVSSILLNSSEDDERLKKLAAEELISVGIGGHYCQERWLGGLRESLDVLGSKITIQMDDLNRAINGWLQEYKEGFISDLEMHYAKKGFGVSHRPHIRNRVVSFLLENKFHIPHQEFYTLADAFIDETHLSNEELSLCLNQYFHPFVIARFIKNKIEEATKERPIFIEKVLNSYQEIATAHLKNEMENDNNINKRSFEVANLTTEEKNVKRRKIEAFKLEDLEEVIDKNGWLKMNLMMTEITCSYRGVLKLLNNLGLF